MSSSYVRTFFRNLAPGIGCPWYETVNQDQNPTDPVWATFEFNAEYSALLSFCGNTAEEGTVDVVVSAQPGSGDAAAIQAVENAATYLMQQQDATGRLVLLSSQPPDEFSSGSADRTYRVVVGINYRFYR